MNRLMSQGQATLSTFAFSRVTHFMTPPSGLGNGREALEVEIPAHYVEPGERLEGNRSMILRVRQAVAVRRFDPRIQGVVRRPSGDDHRLLALMSVRLCRPQCFRWVLAGGPL